MNFRSSRHWHRAKEALIDPARRGFNRFNRRGRIPLHWCVGDNWGDALSPFLVEHLSGRRVAHAAGLHEDRYLVIGSILGDANERSEVWGSGFIRDNQRTAGPPKAVHAVRGPLSRQTLLAQGTACPEIYGDPALLLPMFFNPGVKKAYRVGVIPHYVDKHVACVRAFASDPTVLVIDIESDLEEFVRAVKSCEMILSSSLHGLICADAYGIPRTWIRLSDAVEGGAFKFHDYGLSVGELDPQAVEVEAVRDLHAAARSAIVPSGLDTSHLLRSCPFLSEELRLQACGL